MKILLSLYLFSAVILTQFSAAYVFSKARTNYRRAFSLLALCISIYLFGYLMILNSSSLQEMVFWNQVQYLGLPFISVLWLIVALLYTKTIHNPKSWMIVLLFFVPAVTFLVRLTNPWHHLFYKNWEVRESFGLLSLYMERGGWYYVNISYVILCLLLTIIIYYSGYLKNQAGYTRPQFLVFFFASLLPLIGVVLIVVGYQARSIDYTALIMPVSFLIISYGIFKYDFLEIKNQARETVFENSSAGMVILEPGLRIIDYNKAAQEFFGALKVSLGNYPIDRILDRKPELLEIFKSRSNRDFSVMIDGEKRFYEIDSVPLGNPDDNNVRMLTSIRDITAQKKVQEELKLLATTDSLSGLYNRAEFMRLANEGFARAKHRNEQLSVLMMDLDRFKAINDTFGHAAGDEVIREIGKIIRTSFRKTDIAGRLGGDEFAVVLVNATLNEAISVAEQFVETAAKTRVIYGKQQISFTVSIGVASASGAADNNNSIEDILKQADDALYKAKAKGRNCIAV